MSILKRVGLMFIFGGIFYYNYKMGGWPLAGAYAFAAFYIEFLELNTKKDERLHR